MKTRLFPFRLSEFEPGCPERIRSISQARASCLNPEQVALDWVRATRVSTDERQLIAWWNAADTGLMRK